MEKLYIISLELDGNGADFLTQSIKERIDAFGGKLYLEFGGKLIDDQHAARTLPGFLPDLKIRLLQEFKDDAEVILCINANAIERSKIRADHMISYETEVLRFNLLRDGSFAFNWVLALTWYFCQFRRDYTVWRPEKS